jgi:phosphoketolase
MGANPSANGGRILNALSLPDFVNYALEVPAPGCVVAESPRKLGEFFRDVIKFNPDNFRLFCPDETNSNRLNAVFEATDRCSTAETISIDDHVGPSGRVMEVLSEHCCEGWLEAYLLTGRHGVWATYEGFAQVVDSMLTQHGKWLEQCEELRGAGRLRRSTFFSPATAGATITMASAIRRRDSSTAHFPGAARSFASITRRTPIPCLVRSTIASARAII